MPALIKTPGVQLQNYNRPLPHLTSSNPLASMMALFPGKTAQGPNLTKSFIVSGITALCFVVLIVIAVGPLRSTRFLSRETSNVDPTRNCPIIIYNKQIKTGSTVIANILYRTTEAYGCYNAGCRLHQLLMTGNASHIGAKNGLTLTCHAQEKNKNIVPNLRATHGKDFTYIASVREPMGWFKSTACFFYKLKVNHSVVFNDEGFKKVVDWLLQPAEFEPLESYFFLSLGLTSSSTKRQVMDKLVQYDVIIDNAKISEGLEELEKLLGWKLLKPSQAKDVTYRGPLYETYRADEIKQITRRIAMLYDAAIEIREAKHQRPAFARDEAPKLRGD